MTSEDDNSYRRLDKVCVRYPMSPSTVWRKVKDGTFPKPHKLSDAITAWKNSDLLAWEKDPLNYRSGS